MNRTYTRYIYFSITNARARAFSVSRGFEDLVIKDEEKEVKRYVGQVDLVGKLIFKWVLVGFWAGDLNVWSKELSYSEFLKIYGSDSFSYTLNSE